MKCTALTFEYQLGKAQAVKAESLKFLAMTPVESHMLSCSFKTEKDT